MSEFHKSKPPREVAHIFKKVKNMFGHHDARLHFISTKSLKKHCGDTIIVGELGQVDLFSKVCYVVESERFGLRGTKKVAVHELMHLVFGYHPWDKGQDEACEALSNAVDGGRNE